MPPPLPLFNVLSASWNRFLKTVFWIRISFHADPDPGSLKFPYGSGSSNFYSDPDPKGVKIKEDNLYKQIFN